MNSALTYQFVKADKSLSDFVYGFSLLRNLSEQKESVIIPNGKIDLIFCKTATQPYRVVLMGLETRPKQMPDESVESFAAVSFHPLALEYILKESISDFVDSGKILPLDFWELSENDLYDFEGFQKKINLKIHSLLPTKIDERKRQLFQLIFATNGEISIKELSEKIFWSERQINRYIKQYLGISLKTYCNILRFQASLPSIKEGKLYPELNYTDQSHYIKEVKKLSGVSPKELFKNQNDRFLQFLVYDAK